MESETRRQRVLFRITKWIVGFTLLACTAGYTGISLFTADVLTRPKNHPIRLDPKRVSESAEPWSVRTNDGLTLRGWYCRTDKHRHLIVLVHGMGGTWTEMAPLGHDLHALDYDVLLFDLRGHGHSDPARLSMGRRERGDIRAVQAWAYSEGFSPDRIGWLGYSMGASTLLMEAPNNPYIQVAVIDSPYGNLPELLSSQLSKHSHLPSWFNPGILTAARVAYGIRTDDLMPIRSARQWGNRPLLLIHGESDSIVPVSQARRLAAAAGPSCQAVTLPGVEHVRAYREYPENYIAAVNSFFHSHLSP